MRSWCTGWLYTLVIAASVGSSPVALASPKNATPVSIQTGQTILLPKATANIDVNSPYGSHLAPILEKIKATPAQREKITEIVNSYRSRIQPLRDEYKQKRQEFINQMTSGAAAENIMAKQLELSHLSSDISSKYTLMRLQIRRLLTPQQILIFEDYARQHGWNH